MLEVKGIDIRFGGRREPPTVRGVNLTVGPGETVGLVGESGSGKSSVAKAIVGLNRITTGSINLNGKPIARPGHPLKHSSRLGVQLVFQDPRASLNPRMSIAETLREAAALGPGDRHGISKPVTELLDMVHLDHIHLERYPHQLSGGQLQRVSIARALAVQPRYLLLDEVTASLDVSVQARILNLLRDLQHKLGFSMLYISHDLSVIRYVSDRVYVMRLGEVVESASVERLFDQPETDYTKLLLQSVPVLGGQRWR